MNPFRGPSAGAEGPIPLPPDGGRGGGGGEEEGLGGGNQGGRTDSAEAEAAGMLGGQGALGVDETKRKQIR